MAAGAGKSESRQSGFRVGLLLAALAAIDLALFVAADKTSGPSDASAIALYGLLFGQFSLFAIWSALGTLHGLLRLVGAAAGTSLMALVLGQLHNNGWLWLTLLLLHLITIAAPLLAIRWKWGLQFGRTPETAEPSGAQPASATHRVRQVQFSLKHLMLAITAIAITTGILRLVGLAAPNALQSIRNGIFGEVLLIGGCFAIVGLAAVWSGLGSGRLMLRLIVALVVTGGTSVTLWWFFRGPDRILGAITAIQGLELALALATLRTAGYRLLRQAELPAPSDLD